MPRMLLACLRFLAECPCPRCYVKKKDIHLLGSARDMRQRSTNIRVDTEAIQFDIARTRSWIFQDGLSAGNKRIKDILGGRSLLPIQVLHCIRTC